MTKLILLFDMEGTLIKLSKKPTSYMSIKHQMKEIGVKHGVPVELVKDLNNHDFFLNIE